MEGKKLLWDKEEKPGKGKIENIRVAMATESGLFEARRPRAGVAFGALLTGCSLFLVKQSIYENTKVKIQFVDMTPEARGVPSGPRKLFQHISSLKGMARARGGGAIFSILYVCRAEGLCFLRKDRAQAQRPIASHVPFHALAAGFLSSLQARPLPASLTWLLRHF